MVTDLLEKYEKIEGERFFAELFGNNEYEEVTKVKANIILDIGACAGEFSAYIYDKAKTIYALEPYSEHFKELEENIKEFELTKIKPFRLALSNKNETGKLLIGVRGGHKLGDGEETEEVPIKTLATFMEENNIEHVDVLKIDIEGGEDAVFQSDDFYKVADKIAIITGEHLQGVKDHLIKLGFEYVEGNPNSIYKK